MKKLKKVLSKPFSETGSKRSFYLAYTMIFLIVSFFVFSWFLFSGKSLVRKGDGWNQHYKALVYYGIYLRKIIKHLITEHRLVIPDWDFYIGEGSGVVNALHYYVVGDPIALLSAFVPTRFMHYWYSLTCLLRIYLSGIAFTVLAFGTGKRNRFGIFAGAFSYSFCYWAIFTAIRHPYFMTPMICFPLVILGVEKILRREKPYLFIAAVAVAAASNFYFFYMLVLLTVVYVLVRILSLFHGKLKEAVPSFLRIAGAALVAACLAGIMLLPMVMIFVQDSRMSIDRSWDLFYPLSYYSQLPGIFVSDNAGYWLCMGFSAPVLLAVFLLFRKRKEDRLLKILFVICSVIILFPTFGQILNGMSYMNNRWCWAFALLCCYILTQKWDGLMQLGARDRKALFLLSIGFYVICLLFDKSRSAATFAMIPLLFLACILVCYPMPNAIDLFQKQIGICLVIAISIVNMGFWRYAPTAGNYVSEFVENSKVMDSLNNNEAMAMRGVADGAGETYTRYSGRSLSWNANILFNLSSTQYYWSISNPYVNKYRTEMELGEMSFVKFQGYDDRAAQLALSDTQYYLAPYENGGKVPYGFEPVTEENVFNVRSGITLRYLDELKQELGTDELSDAQFERINMDGNSNWSIFKNKNALPLGYCYDRYLTEEQWEKMNAVQKQEVQLEAAYTGEAVEAIDAFERELPDYKVPYEITCNGHGVTKSEDGYLTTNDKASITLTFEGLPNAETYLEFTGLDFQSTMEYDLYFGDESVDPENIYNRTNWKMLSGDSRSRIIRDKLYGAELREITIPISSSQNTSYSFDYMTPDANFSSGRHDFIINMGYTEEPVTSLTITLPNRGIYTLKDLQVYCVPMEGFEEKIQNLRQDTLQNISFDTDSVQGTIHLDADKLLCMAIPYSTGWQAYVDGEKRETILTNGRYLGVALPEGDHTVTFLYTAPFKRMGLGLSVIGGVLFLAMIIWDRRKQRGPEKNRKRNAGK